MFFESAAAIQHINDLTPELFPAAGRFPALRVKYRLRQMLACLEEDFDLFVIGIRYRLAIGGDIGDLLQILVVEMGQGDPFVKAVRAESRQVDFFRQCQQQRFNRTGIS